MVSESEVWDRLEAINDAHIPVSLRKMGMIQEVEETREEAEAEVAPRAYGTRP